MLTRKHFHALADICKDMKEYYHVSDAAHQRICGDIADFCEKENPNFNRQKFLLACQPTERKTNDLTKI